MKKARVNNPRSDSLDVQEFIELIRADWHCSRNEHVVKRTRIFLFLFRNTARYRSKCSPATLTVMGSFRNVGFQLLHFNGTRPSSTLSTLIRPRDGVDRSLAG